MAAAAQFESPSRFVVVQVDSQVAAVASQGQASSQFMKAAQAPEKDPLA
jgi:hypothetical protein